MNGIKAYIGSRQYYKRIFLIMLPILLQNAITNFVNLLDNIMVGQVGTEPMSGVAIANQLIFVFNLCIFGGLSGAGIFTAQFFGKGDTNGVKHTIRMKTYIGIVAVLGFAAIFWFCGSDLIKLFIHEGNEGLDLAATFDYGMRYLRIMMIQMVPFMVTQIFSSTLREAGQTVVPMRASIVAVLVNLIGNYILIFGKFGAPALGIMGAAIATIISRFVECGILVIYANKNHKKYPFFKGLFKTFKIEKHLAIEMIKKGTPLLLNEVLWSAGMAMLNQCYSVRGLEVVSATNISSTIANLFFCVTMAIGSTITIVIGQRLGAGKLDEAVADYKKILFMALVLCTLLGVVIIFVSPLLANIYNTTPAVKEMATRFLRVVGIFFPVAAYTNSCYFTLRSGGKTIITFIFDSAFTWVGSISLAFCLTRFTILPILTVYVLVNCMDLIKCLIGYFMIKSRKWVVNLVAEDVITE